MTQKKVRRSNRKNRTSAALRIKVDALEKVRKSVVAKIEKRRDKKIVRITKHVEMAMHALREIEVLYTPDAIDDNLAVVQDEIEAADNLLYDLI